MSRYPGAVQLDLLAPLLRIYFDVTDTRASKLGAAVALIWGLSIPLQGTIDPELQFVSAIAQGDVNCSEVSS